MERVRFGVNPPQTRIVIDVDQLVRFRASRLPDLERLIVDLPEVRWPSSSLAEAPPRGIAKDYVFGELSSGRNRLIVDVGEPFRIIRTITLEPDRNADHYRLVVDVAPLADQPRETAERSPPVAATEIASSSPARVVRPQLRPPLDADAFSEQRRPIIVLDAGHGGRDPGAVGVNGVYERDVNLTMAHELAERLRQTGRYEVVLTRTDDRFITLLERIEAAREASGDLFISIHADSIDNPSQRGASVYTLSETASDAEAANLARKENKAGIINGADFSNQDAFVTSILIDLAQRDTNNKSIGFAELLVSELGNATELLKKTRRFAGFAVLKAPDIPSVLLELGYLSNRKDAELLTTQSHRDRLAEAIVRAIDDFFGRTS